jgi:16S rRNA (cytidine1402-2'-O)-methyltransferase
MSKLYIIPTPIGNLEDITLRAIRLLKKVDLVLAEDTRTSKKLFSYYNIDTPLCSFHMHNEHQVLSKYIDTLKSGNYLALISDAGTPAISDPGFLLIRECIKEGIELCSLPGATAFLPALINSGLSSDKFVFEGFLPIKKGRKKTFKNFKRRDKNNGFL